MGFSQQFQWFLEKCPFAHCHKCNIPWRCCSSCVDCGKTFVFLLFLCPLRTRKTVVIVLWLHHHYMWDLFIKAMFSVTWKGTRDWSIPHFNYFSAVFSFSQYKRTPSASSKPRRWELSCSCAKCCKDLNSDGGKELLAERKSEIEIWVAFFILLTDFRTQRGRITGGVITY